MDKPGGVFMSQEPDEILVGKLTWSLFFVLPISDISNADSNGKFSYRV